MIIVVDAYNILKQLTSAEMVSEQERIKFIELLGRYARKKKHKIIVVFDGGPYEWTHKEKQSGITVIYSGVNETADEYIMSYLEQRQTSDILLVSSDHELGLFASRLAIPSINSDDFYKLVKQAFQKESDEIEKAERAIKISKHSSEEIDTLMEQAAKEISIKAEDVTTEITFPQKQKKGSRRERKLLSKLKKL